MSEGVEVRDGDKICKINFVAPAASIPVLLADTGQVEWVRWGRRKKEPGQGPYGGWARLTTVRAGSWEALQPTRGYVLAERFIQESIRGRRLSQWTPVPDGQAIDCLVIGEGSERVAYVITTTPPPALQKTYSRWPHLIDLPAGREAEQPPTLSDAHA